VEMGRDWVADEDGVNVLHSDHENCLKQAYICRPNCLV
jgi:hypothetical protein